MSFSIISHLLLRGATEVCFKSETFTATEVYKKNRTDKFPFYVCKLGELLFSAIGSQIFDV